MRLQRTFSGRQTVLPAVPKTQLNLLTQGKERAIGELPLYHHILRDIAGLVQEGGEGWEGLRMSRQQADVWVLGSYAG